MALKRKPFLPFKPCPGGVSELSNVELHVRDRASPAATALFGPADSHRGSSPTSRRRREITSVLHGSSCGRANDENTNWRHNSSWSSTEVTGRATPYEDATLAPLCAAIKIRFLAQATRRGSPLWRALHQAVTSGCKPQPRAAGKKGIVIARPDGRFSPSAGNICRTPRFLWSLAATWSIYRCPAATDCRRWGRPAAMSGLCCGGRESAGRPPSAIASGPTTTGAFGLSGGEGVLLSQKEKDDTEHVGFGDRRCPR